jgi:hypothetical protein
MNTRRAYQDSALQAFRQRRIFCLLWERQAGKSTTLADMALNEMMRFSDRTCIYASASLLLARELILKQARTTDLSIRDLVRKEAEMLFASAIHAAVRRHAGQRAPEPPPGLGHFVTRFTKPFARLLDRHLGTKLATCKACARRQTKLDQWSHNWRLRLSRLKHLLRWKR